MDEIESLVLFAVGTPRAATITISCMSLVLIHLMWFAATRRNAKNLEQHLTSLLGAAVLAAAIIAGFMVVGGSGSDAGADTGPKIDNMVAIEASIAIKTSPQKQPQKKTREPDPVKKPEGVSHDDLKKPDPDKKKPDDKPRKSDDPPPLKPPPDRRNHDDDDPIGPIKDPVGPPSDNQRGFADVTRGHPFFQRVARDIHESFEFPKILGSDNKAANGCFYFNLDGKIAGWKLLPKSNDPELDDAVERALKKVEKLRNQTPEAVPNELLKQATTTWTCFKFEPQKREE